MKTIFSIVILCVLLGSSFGQGLINFANNSATLISVGSSAGIAMPARTSFETTIYFALFVAPSGTDVKLGPDDPNWQTVTAYTTNASSTVGRLTTRNLLPTEYPAGSSVDFLVRGWSAYLGSTWEEARTNLQWFWFDIPGVFFGESAVGQNIVLGDGFNIPTSTVFGPGSSQVPGFTLNGMIPEPTT